MVRTPQPAAALPRTGRAGGVPAADAVRLEYWTGQSAWQGEWKPLEATVERAEGRWLWQVTAKDLTRGTQKVRWIFPAGGRPIVLKSLSAYTRASWKTVALRLQSQHASAGKPVKVRIYNGLILDPAGEGSLERSWDTAAPLALKVRASSAKRFKVDRTVLQIEQPEGTVAVAVEDVLANGAVYVPHAGLLVAREPAPVTLEAHLREIAGRTTVLEQVRELPDQSYSQAMAKTHNPVQNFGPMLLSLACDNRKFTVHREGPVCFHLGDAPDGQYPSIFWHPRLELNTLDCHQVVPRSGSGTSSELARHLDGGWLPRPITALTDGGVVYRQGACVIPLDNTAPAGAPGWLRERAACVVEYTVENPQAKPAEVALGLTFLTSAKNNQHAELREVDGGIAALSGGRLMGLVSTAGAASLAARAEAGVVNLSGKLPAGGTARLLVYLPAWKLAPDRAAELAGGSNGAEELKAYWDEVLSEALQLELPDQALANVIRASQVHCMLAARNEDRGARISPWIASDRYGPLESESQAVIRGMDMTGCGDFARRGLEFFLNVTTRLDSSRPATRSWERARISGRSRSISGARRSGLDERRRADRGAGLPMDRPDAAEDDAARPPRRKAAGIRPDASRGHGRLGPLRLPVLQRRPVLHGAENGRRRAGRDRPPGRGRAAGRCRAIPKGPAAGLSLDAVALARGPAPKRHVGAQLPGHVGLFRQYRGLLAR